MARGVLTSVLSGAEESENMLVELNKFEELNVAMNQ